MRRVFVTGCPRSGTTLLQGLLATARNVTSFTESHFFDRYFPPWGLRFLGLRPGLAARAEEFLAENRIAVTIPASLGSDDPMLAGDGVLAVLDAVASARGSQAWIEKTPDHLFRIPWLEALSPGAQFVHVLREPGPTVESLVAASREWGRPRSRIFCAAKWSAAALRLDRLVGCPGHHAVCYEDMIATPAVQIGRLTALLGLEWTPDRLEAYRGVVADLVADGESWKSTNLSAPPGEGQPRRPTGRPPTWLSALRPLHARLRARIRGDA